MSVHRTFPKSVQPGIPRLSELKSGWKNYLIGQLFEEVKRPANIQDDQKYQLVTVRRARGGIAPRSKLFGNEISVKSQYYIRTGDFLISKRQIVHGACAVVTEELDGAIVSNEYSVLRCKNVLRLDYLAQLFHSIYFQQTFFHSSIGVHIEKMIFKLEDWFKWPVNLPHPPEQQNTATFLTSVDRKIEQLGQKKDLLEQYKKGVMQKLFSQELRFKDAQGNGFPDWEEKQLGEIANVNPKASTLPKEFVYIDLESVVNGSLIKENKIQNSGAPSRAQRLLKKGDVLFQMVRPYQKNNYYFDTEGDYVASTGYAQLQAKGSAKYLFQLLHTDSFVNEVLDRCTGTSYPAINSSDLGKINLSMPSLPEQQKIADFLSSIDRKTNLVAAELTLAISFKKGLLQRMFI